MMRMMQWEAVCRGLFLTQYYHDNEMRSDIGRISTDFGSEDLKETDNLEDLGADGG